MHNSLLLNYKVIYIDNIYISVIYTYMQMYVYAAIRICSIYAYAFIRIYRYTYMQLYTYAARRMCIYTQYTHMQLYLYTMLLRVCTLVIYYSILYRYIHTCVCICVCVCIYRFFYVIQECSTFSIKQCIYVNKS